MSILAKEKRLQCIINLKHEHRWPINYKGNTSVMEVGGGRLQKISHHSIAINNIITHLSDGRVPIEGSLSGFL